MPKLRSDDGSERHTENSVDGSERQTENSHGSEHQNWKAMMALNAKTENSDDSERQNWKAMMALNPKLKMRLWMSIWKPMMALNAETENTTRIALNTNTDEWWLWTPNKDAMMALNTEWSETWLWTPNKAKHGSERRKKWRNDSERRNEVDNSLECQTKQSMAPTVGMNDEMALNTDTDEWWLWTSKLKIRRG